MIARLRDEFRRYVASAGARWNQFWFTPRTPTTLSGLRVITGIMLLYSHLVLAGSLLDFLGPGAWIANDLAGDLHAEQRPWAISYLTSFDSPAVIGCHHAVVIFVTLCFTIGLATRITAPLAVFFQLMYLHRLTGVLFGFDQIVTYVALYLSVTPCGAMYSVDAWLRDRKGKTSSSPHRRLFADASPSVPATIGTRLLQLHLCVIYLFGGLAKARGEMWWDGTAVWFSVANYEYQSLDMTWMANHPTLFSGLTHVTLFWEIFYCALVWPRLTRPLVLLIAVAVHGGIAMFLGMITFGVMMIAANLIFIDPDWLERQFRSSSNGTSGRGVAD